MSEISSEGRKESPVSRLLGSAFSAKNLSSGPVQVALGVFFLVMSFLAVAMVVASWSEQAVAALVFVLFKTVLVTVFLAVVLVGLASSMKQVLRRNAEYRQRMAIEELSAAKAGLLAAAQDSSDQERQEYATRLLRDDEFFKVTERAERRRAADLSRKAVDGKVPR